MKTPQSPAPVAGRPLTAEDVALLRKGDVLRLLDDYRSKLDAHAGGNSIVEDVDPADGTITLRTSTGAVDYFYFNTMKGRFDFVSRPASEQPNPGRDDVTAPSSEAAGQRVEGSARDKTPHSASEQPVEAIGAGREEIDLYDDKVQEGIAWTMRQWGEALGLETWTQGDGSESVEGDVGAEIHTILVDAGLRDPETNEMAALSPASPARTPMGGRVDGHGGVTWPAASADLASEEGLESIDALVDMARVGVNLMERLPEGYDYSDCPTEIVTDLQNKLDEAKTPMGGEVEALREALECVEDYDHTGRLAGVLRQAIDGAVRIDHLTPDQQSDIRAHITGLSDPEEDTYQAPEHGWTCFHCGATFKTTRGARMHFGHNVTGRPKCHDPERLVEIYDGAEAAVAAASPARADFEVRVARRDEARNAIIAALAAPTPMGGEVEALREAAKREEVARIVELAIVRHGVEETALEGTLRDADAILKALAASSPSPAQGGESGHVGTIEVLENLLRSGGETWLNSEQEWALKSAIAALSASPQPEAGEASAYRVRPLKDDPEEWRLLHPEQALGFIDRKGWETQPLYTRAAPPFVQPVEGK